MTNFSVSIDVECDMPDWKPKPIPTLENIKAIPKLHELFEKYDIKATYLVTYPVATETESVQILSELKKRNNCEIGAHFHPWTTPPISPLEIQQAIYPFQLTEDIHKIKLKNLTEAIIKSFKVHPKSYRAGRFGFDTIGLRIIKDLNYEIDSSVTPLTNWAVDYRNSPLVPYYLDETNICSQAGSGILEIPVTIDLNFKYLKKFYLNLPEKFKGGLKYIGFKRVWLRPSYSSFNDMKKTSMKLIKKKCPILNMMFHSSELTTSSSPFNRTQKALNNFNKKLEEYFKFLKQNKIESQTLTEFKKENYLKRFS